MTAQGLSDFANRGMIRAASAMALTGIELVTSSEKLAQVKEEHAKFEKQNPYNPPIPKDVSPSTLGGKRIY